MGEEKKPICVISPICEISMYDMKAHRRVLGKKKETHGKREGLWGKM